MFGEGMNGQVRFAQEPQSRPPFGLKVKFSEGENVKGSNGEDAVKLRFQRRRIGRVYPNRMIPDLRTHR